VFYTVVLPVDHHGRCNEKFESTGSVWRELVPLKIHFTVPVVWPLVWTDSNGQHENCYITVTATFFLGSNFDVGIVGNDDDSARSHQESSASCRTVIA
jgi:hypothetical protein